MDQVLTLLSSPVSKPLVPKPPGPNPNPVKPSSKTELVPRELELTLKSLPFGPTHCRLLTPPTPPITFKHEGRVPKKTQKGRKFQNGPPYLSVKKIQVDSERKDIKSTTFSENIINLNCCTNIKMPASMEENFRAGRTKCRSPMQIRTWWNTLALFLVVNL